MPKHDDLSDLFCTAAKVVIPPVPVPTGLSEEEDAQRYLALRFNPDLKFCPNCEVVVDGNLTGFYCHTCTDTLQEVGTAPRRKKHR